MKGGRNKRRQKERHFPKQLESLILLKEEKKGSRNKNYNESFIFTCPTGRSHG